MRLVLVGSGALKLRSFLAEQGEETLFIEGNLEEFKTELRPSDLLISYGYRHIIRENILDFFIRRPLNLHISLLPWNRGADPNLWSFLECTPKGVTIHEIDSGIDTGDILLQKEVTLSATDTLKSSYAYLQEEMTDLFCRNWKQLQQGTIRPVPQKGEGSTHRSHEKQYYESLLSLGWDTPVSLITGKACRRVK